MLLGSFDLLADDPSGFFRLTVLIVFALLTAVTIHEFSHALVANSLGDNTARRLGRLSLNPMRHLDPGGAIMMFIAGFGWGKPVPVDPRQLSHGYTGTALVAAAGPLSNLMFAFLLAIPFKTGVLVPASLSLDRVVHVMTGGLREGIADVLAVVIFFNLLLGVFNLLPVGRLASVGRFGAERTYCRLRQITTQWPRNLGGHHHARFCLGPGHIVGDHRPGSWGVDNCCHRLLISAA